MRVLKLEIPVNGFYADPSYSVADRLRLPGLAAGGWQINLTGGHIK